MRTWNRRWSFVAVLVAGIIAGCQRQDSPEEPLPEAPAASLTSGHESTPGPGAAPSAPAVAPSPPPPPVEVTPQEPSKATSLPEVQMTEADRSSCLVCVGDPMPDGQLADLKGQSQPLRELLGKKLTIILFWTAGESKYASMAATAALEDLQKDVFEPYGEKGVAVVAVNVGDTPEAAGTPVAESKASYPQLLDPSRKFYATIATGNLPRLYAVDADGKVIWMDIEFSETTRDRLQQVVEVVVK